jgi:predicted glycosyltransferase
VPFAEGNQDEQTNRAARLERLGAVRVLPADRADGRALAAAIKQLLAFRPEPVALDLDGARNSALTVSNLVARADAPPPDSARPVLEVAS